MPYFSYLLIWEVEKDGVCILIQKARLDLRGCLLSLKGKQSMMCFTTFALSLPALNVVVEIDVSFEL